MNFLGLIELQVVRFLQLFHLIVTFHVSLFGPKSTSDFRCRGWRHNNTSEQIEIRGIHTAFNRVSAVHGRSRQVGRLREGLDVHEALHPGNVDCNRCRLCLHYAGGLVPGASL